MIAVLRYLRNPEDRMNKKFGDVCLSSINRKFGESEADESVFQNLQSIFPAILVRGNLKGSFRNFSAYFPGNGTGIRASLSGYGFRVRPKESADLNRFLRWWDETGYRKTIATPDGQNAIRILTVHNPRA